MHRLILSLGNTYEPLIGLTSAGRLAFSPFFAAEAFSRKDRFCLLVEGLFVEVDFVALYLVKLSSLCWVRRANMMTRQQ